MVWLIAEILSNKFKIMMITFYILKLCRQKLKFCDFLTLLFATAFRMYSANTTVSI